MPTPATHGARYRAAAEDHLAWCHDHGIDIIGGRWSLEDPISGLLLAAMLQPDSARILLPMLCGQSWDNVQVTSAWWPSSLVDLLVGFTAEGRSHLLVLENKHLATRSNQPGYKKLPDHEIRWQTEVVLREIDQIRADGGDMLLGGPFDPEATLHPVLLDAKGRTMAETFPMYGWMSAPHRHELWTAVSYAELAAGLRDRYEHEAVPALEPLLSQLFAPKKT